MSDLVEVFRKALMDAHHDDWDMETVAEAAHICARQLEQVGEVDWWELPFVPPRAWPVITEGDDAVIGSLVAGEPVYRRVEGERDG